MGEGQAQHGNRGGRESDPQHSSQKAKNESLSEKLREKLKAFRAERLTKRNFPGVCGGPDHEEICDIGAGDEQDEEHRREKAEHGGAQGSNELVTKGCERDADIAVGCRIGGGETSGDGLQVGSCFGQSHAGAEAA